MAAAGLRGGALHARLGRAPLLEWVRVGAELGDGATLTTRAARPSVTSAAIAHSSSTAHG